MNKTEKADFMVDSQTIDGVMRKYSGEKAGHFGFICKDGERQFFLGGRCDLVGVHLSEALAMLVNETPGLPSDFIDAVCKTAKEIYATMGETEKVQ